MLVSVKNTRDGISSWELLLSLFTYYIRNKIMVKAPTKKKAPKAPTAPVVEPVVEPVELANVLKVKNQKGKEFEVSKSYYLNNVHKLTLIDA